MTSLIGAASERDVRPVLTLFCGPPGAGKTTLARQLETEGRGVRLCTDEWQASLGVDPQDGEFHEVLQSRLYQHGLDLLDHGVDVILEDGLWTRGERAEKFADARAHNARIEFHVFDVPAEVLRRRVQARNGSASRLEVAITPETLDRVIALFQPPNAEELALVDTYCVHRTRG